MEQERGALARGGNQGQSCCKHLAEALVGGEAAERFVKTRLARFRQTCRHCRFVAVLPRSRLRRFVDEVGIARQRRFFFRKRFEHLFEKRLTPCSKGVVLPAQCYHVVALGG